MYASYFYKEVKDQTCTLKFIEFYELMKFKISVHSKQVTDAIQEESKLIQSRRGRGIQKQQQFLHENGNFKVETKQEYATCLFYPFETYSHLPKRQDEGEINVNGKKISQIVHISASKKSLKGLSCISEESSNQA